MKREFASLTSQEVLHVAIFMEERNAQIYENFAQMFAEFRDRESQQIAASFQEMATEERGHGTVLQDRYTERYGNRACALTDQDITEVIEVPQLEDGEMFILGKISRQKALEVALVAEQEARRFYTSVTEFTQDPQLRALYTEMAEFEQDHARFFEQKLTQMKPAAGGG